MKKDHGVPMIDLMKLLREKVLNWSQIVQNPIGFSNSMNSLAILMLPFILSCLSNALDMNQPMMMPCIRHLRSFISITRKLWRS